MKRAVIPAVFAILSLVVSCSDDSTEKKVSVDSDQAVTDIENNQTDDDEVADADSVDGGDTADIVDDEISDDTDLDLNDKSPETADEDVPLLERKFTAGKIDNTSTGTTADYDGSITFEDGSEGQIRITFGEGLGTATMIDLGPSESRVTVEVKSGAEVFKATEGYVMIKGGNVLLGNATFAVRNLKLASKDGDIVVSSADIEVDTTDSGTVIPGQCRAFSYDAKDTRKNENGYYPTYVNYFMKDVDGTWLILMAEFHGDKGNYTVGQTYELGKGAHSYENCGTEGICFYIWTDKDGEDNADGGIDEDKFFPLQGKLTITGGDIFNGNSDVKVEDLKLVRYVLNDQYKWVPVDGDCIETDLLTWERAVK